MKLDVTSTWTVHDTVVMTDMQRSQYSILTNVAEWLAPYKIIRGNIRHGLKQHRIWQRI